MVRAAGGVIRSFCELSTATWLFGVLPNHYNCFEVKGEALRHMRMQEIYYRGKKEKRLQNLSAAECAVLLWQDVLAASEMLSGLHYTSVYDAVIAQPAFTIVIKYDSPVLVSRMVMNDRSSERNRRQMVQSQPEVNSIMLIGDMGLRFLHLIQLFITRPFLSTHFTWKTSLLLDKRRWLVEYGKDIDCLKTIMLNLVEPHACTLSNHS